MRPEQKKFIPPANKANTEEMKEQARERDQDSMGK